MESIEGCHAESFGRLPYYAKIVLANHERSVVTLQCDVDESESIPHAPVFKIFFLDLSALRMGSWRGVVLFWECKESWGFFFENLSNMLGGFSYDKPWTFMSDRQKEVCKAYLCQFQRQFAGAALKKYFWQAAKSYNAAGFNFALHKIKELKPAAYDWLLKIHAEMWSRHAFDERLKNDHVTNNISKSFNHWVGDLRSKPVLTLVDGLRTKLMCRLQQRKLKGLKISGDLVPNVVKELNKIKEESRKCHLLVAGEHEFEKRVFGVCDSRFSKENYMKAYSYCIHPVPDPTFWPQDLEVEPTNLLPPIVRRMPGRPKKNRRKEPGEAHNIVRRSNMVRCKVSNDLGHNKRTCHVI
ncbi:UNVERIFIED_CONTAM: hypothetical protein Slati_4204000 [Sesamum latifolium]|uniref:Uncharacterized protein n=1 Tax=Sesamum latifolium TaxID=2727402 RepID=A0AAW2TDG6_9LAMI